jgi:hypothetical protein
MIRVFWKISDVTPHNPAPNNVQKIYRTAQGVLYSDSVGYDFSLNSKRELNDQEVAYTDIRIFENDPFDVGDDYNLIRIDESLEEEEISKTITQALNLDHKDGVPPYIRNYVPQREQDRYYPNNVTLIQEDLIPRYSVWCELHNKLMISAEKGIHSVFPDYSFYVGASAQFYTYPLRVANTWKRKWSVVATINGQISTIKSYASYESAEKAVKKYVKRTFNGNRRLDGFPNLKRDSFFHDVGDGIGGYDALEIKLYKEKELDVGIPIV